MYIVQYLQSLTSQLHLKYPAHLIASQPTPLDKVSFGISHPTCLVIKLLQVHTCNHKITSHAAIYRTSGRKGQARIYNTPLLRIVIYSYAVIHVDKPPPPKKNGDGYIFFVSSAYQGVEACACEVEGINQGCYWLAGWGLKYNRK